MKNKITLHGLFLVVLSVFGCSNPECRIEDFNGNCCIDEHSCGENYVDKENSSEALRNACLELGQYRKPILCPSDFNITEYANCTKIEVKKMCKGGDNLWSGAQPEIYEVQCCE